MRIIVEITFGQFNSNVHFVKERVAMDSDWQFISQNLWKLIAIAVFVFFSPFFFNPSSKLYSIFVEVTIRSQSDPFSK